LQEWPPLNGGQEKRIKLSSPSNDIATQAAKVESDFHADVLLYFGPIVRNWDDYIIDICAAKNKKKNVLLILTTLGGDAHAAYRIARGLHQNYHRNRADGTKEGEVIIYVPSCCTSAGTLITLAADRLILSSHSELGPLDVQIRKPDEVGERTSGLTPIQALSYLDGETKKFFKSQFEGLRFTKSLAFSTKMAADIAAQLASGLLSKLYDQIDPLRLAEYDRTNRIAAQYGERIKTSNVKVHTIKRLLEDYPSHEFCIDSNEAKELFAKVEEPTPELESLGNTLKFLADRTLTSEEPNVFYLSELLPDKSKKTESPKNESEKTEQSNSEGATVQTGNGGEKPHSRVVSKAS
jgi:hypothetical protein